ncbi:hypothetical protein [Flavobacterium filum]|uniref:hypothetical protein n=1 Tax=Flavobacterium filum TaxID=370974 RepID=UPI0003F9AD1B|nr:hypothetical protein [Flavobacterium filum]
MTTPTTLNKYSHYFKKLNRSSHRELGKAGKNGQIDHLIPEQIDHRFRFKMTT